MAHKDKAKSAASTSEGNLVYCLGLIGAGVYFVQQANGFGEIVVALLKALVWPAFVIYDLLKFLG